MYTSVRARPAEHSQRRPVRGRAHSSPEDHGHLGRLGRRRCSTHPPQTRTSWPKAASSTARGSGNLDRIGYAKTRQLAAAAGLETESNAGRLVTSLYRYVSIRRCNQPRAAGREFHPTNPARWYACFAAVRLTETGPGRAWPRRSASAAPVPGRSCGRWRRARCRRVRPPHRPARPGTTVSSRIR